MPIRPYSFRAFALSLPEQNLYFLELQAQLEGTENRINVERTRYNQTVKEYNQFGLRLMVKLILHPEEKPYFEAQEGTDTAPVVEF